MSQKKVSSMWAKTQVELAATCEEHAKNMRKAYTIFEEILPQVENATYFFADTYGELDKDVMPNTLRTLLELTDTYAEVISSRAEEIRAEIPQSLQEYYG